jgi:hypothetical protein
VTTETKDDELEPRDLSVLAYIALTWRRTGKGPTWLEVAQARGISCRQEHDGRAEIERRLNKLRGAHLIESNGKPRSLKLTPAGESELRRRMALRAEAVR